MIERAQQILKKQKLIFLFCLVAFVFGLGVFFLMANMGHRQAVVSNQHVALPGDKVDYQEIWMTQLEGQNKKIEAQNQILEQKLVYLQDLLVDQKRRVQDDEIEKSDLKKELFKLKQELKDITLKSEQRIETPRFQSETVINQQVKSESSSFSFNLDPFSSPNHNSDHEDAKVHLRSPLTQICMEVDKATSQKKKAEPIDGKIFAGTTVKALLVSSVDAVCGVFSNSDPVPVKLRIIDNGHLPKHLTAQLKGGLVIGSAFGNISNERVYIRLERMSLFTPKGEGIEMEVAGYVSGEDGRFGLRGFVIDKSTKMIKNAAFSGFLSGTGQILQSAVSKRPSDSWNNYTAVGRDMLKQGAVDGAGNAFDMLADYYIRRAEQVQPVLQVNAGRVVDITFTHGTSIGDLQVKEQIKSCRESARRKS